MYLPFVIAGFFTMVLGVVVERWSLRRGGTPHPRAWLAVCWLGLAVFGWSIAEVIAWHDAPSWILCGCAGGDFVVACVGRQAAVEAAVCIALEANPDGIHGLDLWHASRVSPGSLYPLLFRWERQGLVRSWWDDLPADGGPRRRYYALTEEAAWRS